MDKNKIRYICPSGLSVEATKRLLSKLNELADQLEKYYKGIKFYSEVLVDGSKQCISVGASEKQMLEIPTLVYRLTQLSVFGRFLNTAMTVLKRYHEKCINFSLEEYCKLNDITLPKEPVQQPAMTEGEYFATLPPDDLCRYLSLQARAAAIGKFIHQKGVYAKERNRFIECLSEPLTVTGQGTNMMVTTVQPSMSEDEVEAMLFRLQDMHREVQKKINSVKFACKTTILEDEKRKAEDYLKAQNSYLAEYDEIQRRYSEYKSHIIAESTTYGIAIPPMFEEVYNWIKKN